MHIPDFIFGYSPWGIAVGIVGCVIAAVLLGFSINWARKNLTAQKIAILAVIAAGIFALQAFNLPTGFGVSGHLVGGALAAIVFGSPFAAVFVLTIVLIIQALIFGDGGVLALGLNIINMGFIAGCVGFYSYKFASKKLPRPFSAGIAGWLACVIAACFCALELALVGAIPLNVGLPVMFIYHAIIGAIEGVITAVLIALLFKVRPDLTGNTEKKPVSIKKFLVVGLIAALVIGGCAVFFASSNPDGLDSTFLVSEGQKEVFAPATGDEVTGEANDLVQWNAPLPDYSTGEESGPAGGLIALVIGLVVALGAIVAVALIATSGKQKSGNRPGEKGEGK